MQLEDQLIARAVQPLQDRISSLENMIIRLQEENAALTATARHLEENQLIQLRLIKQLKDAARKDPGSTEVSRAEKIEKYLAARPDHKATFETLKGYLRIDNVLLNQAIKTLIERSPGRFGITRTPGDGRKRTIVMLPK